MGMENTFLFASRNEGGRLIQAVPSPSILNTISNYSAIGQCQHEHRATCSSMTCPERR